MPVDVAALPPPAIDDPVPVGDAEVPPVPTVDAAVPTAVAEPPVPPEILVCAASGDAAAKKIPTAVHLMQTFMVLSFYGDEVEIVHPLTVTVLAEVEPGPPDVEDELDTAPPPART